MSFSSKVTEKLTIIYIRVSHFMERNKLNIYISTLEREIQELKLQIGIVCYDRWKNTRLRVEDIEELLKIIDAKNEEIKKQKELIQQLSEQEKRILGIARPAGLAVPSVSAADAETKDTESAEDAEEVKEVKETKSTVEANIEQKLS